MDDRAPLKTRLRNVRKDADLSQQKLANRIGVSVRQISRLETGRSRRPGKMLRLAWARECGVDPSELEPDAEEEESESVTLEARVDALRAARLAGEAA